jgi:hypothetical protein
LGLIGFGVTALSDKVGGLDRLYDLDLRENRLTMVPESIGRLGELRNLYLSSNQLHSIPETVGQLANLQRLYILLFNHRICTFWLTLSFSVFFTGTSPATSSSPSQRPSVSSRTSKCCTFCHSIHRICTFWLTLSFPFHRSLYNNQLQSIPGTIGQLTNLQHLYILLFNHRICTFWLILSLLFFFTGTSTTTSSSPSRRSSVSS